MYRSIFANQFVTLLLFRRFQTPSYLSYGSILELKEKNMVEPFGAVRSAVKVSFSFSLVSPHWSLAVRSGNIYHSGRNEITDLVIKCFEKLTRDEYWSLKSSVLSASHQ